MAQRARPTPLEADNTAGSLPAALNDWPNGVADSMSARDSKIPPITMPDIRLQALSLQVITLDCLSLLREESIYECWTSPEPKDRISLLPLPRSFDNDEEKAYKQCRQGKHQPCIVPEPA
jgi:hypothetical protein